jgi:F420-non-reducing hydrogenase small subunit
MTDQAGKESKLKLGMYWAASCGGCDISLLEIGPHLLELIESAEVAFWPCIADPKYKDMVAAPDGYLDFLFWNGGIRNSEQEELAHLLRRKCKTLVAYGSCAIDGGIPALANLTSVRELLQTIYHQGPSLDNATGTEPQRCTSLPQGELGLPELYPCVLRLRDVVKVDYQIPGCPPQALQVWKILQLVIGGRIPPTNEAVKVGCETKAVCDECPREKKKVKIKKIQRPHEAIPEPEWCLLEQGFLCAGPATRSGCGALCLKADLACRGCYGASGESEDQGTALISAIASNFEAENEEQVQEMINQIVDPVGTFYRFSLSSSELKGLR